MCEPDCEHCEPSFDLDEFIDECSDTPAPKRRKRIRWYTIDGYDAITDRLKEKGHTLAINRQQWLKAKFTNTSAPPVVCGVCNKISSETSINRFMAGQGLGCPHCRMNLLGNRRIPNPHPCSGKCGNSKCEFVGGSRWNLEAHLGRTKKACPVCDKLLRDVNRHMRKLHPESCEEHNVHKVIEIILMPDNLALLGLTQSEYSFVKDKCRLHLINDAKIKWADPIDIAYAQKLAESDVLNRNAHSLAESVLFRWLSTPRGQERLDEVGGHTKLEFDFFTNWQISLDRKDDKKPHTVDNIQIVCLKLQGCHGVTFGKQGEDTVNEMRRLYVESNAISDDTHAIRAREVVNYNKSCGKTHSNLLYMRCSHAGNKLNKGIQCDIKTEDIYEMFLSQKGRCAISGFQMNDFRSDDRRFRMSIDRIDSSKGYSKENIRLVCMPFNVTDRSRLRETAHITDGNPQWTTQLFLEYLGL